MKTLREVCEMCRISRRVVQGYEKAGLIKASGKNDRGHLLYDEMTQERIRLIRFLQNLGFSLKNIREIIDAQTEVFENAVKQQIQNLEKDKRKIDNLVQEAYELIREERK